MRRVAAGGSAIDPEVIATMVRREVRDRGGSDRDSGIAALTPRRIEVLELMAQGYSNARIARELVVTEKAVARSIALIFQTLGLPPDPDDHRRVIAVIRYLNRDRRPDPVGHPSRPTHWPTHPSRGASAAPARRTFRSPPPRLLPQRNPVVSEYSLS